MGYMGKKLENVDRVKKSKVRVTKITMDTSLSVVVSLFLEFAGFVMMMIPDICLQVKVDKHVKNQQDLWNTSHEHHPREIAT